MDAKQKRQEIGEWLVFAVICGGMGLGLWGCSAFVNLCNRPDPPDPARQKAREDFIRQNGMSPEAYISRQRAKAEAMERELNERPSANGYEAQAKALILSGAWRAAGDDAKAKQYERQAVSP